MNKSLVILQREWLELRRQPGLLLGISLLPILSTLLPIGIAALVVRLPEGFQQPLPFDRLNPAMAGMTLVERQQTFIGQIFGVLLLLVPLIVPGVLAAHSIIGEKVARTLEPVLATPIETVELLIGKCLAAAIPAVVVSWVCAALFVAGMSLVVVSPAVLAAVINPGWLVALLVCAPLIVMIAVAAMVAISARVSDERTAQQISAVAVVPILLVVFGQLSGLLVLDPWLALAAAAVLAVLSFVALRLATRVFRRETILTRWS